MDDNRLQGYELILIFIIMKDITRKVSNLDY